MPDLWLEDIRDVKAYPDSAILADVRALIKAGQREDTVLDYKKDISPKDNWPEAVASFANSYGGLIIFGVEGKEDQPRRLTGFDLLGTETKTRLGSTILSRVQPRPDFQIRVVTLDTDKSKEVALLRVSEGTHPPYVHAKDHERRVYIRVGGQKAEADHLQLSALFEKRERLVSEAESFLADLVVGTSPLIVHDPPDSNLVTRQSYRFVLAPDDRRAARRLTNEVEEQFRQCITPLFPSSRTERLIRTSSATCFVQRTSFGGEQLLSVTSTGTLGFAAHACYQTGEESPPKSFFNVQRFYGDLIRFMSVSSLFYEKSQYYGSSLLDVSLKLLDGANVWASSGLFLPPLEIIPPQEAVSRIRVGLHPPVVSRWQEYVEAVLNDLARCAGRVLSPNSQEARTEVQVAISRLPKA